MKAHNIEEVLSLLRFIISETRQNGDRAGYFAALYYKMTAAIKRDMQSHVFVDAARMERLDVAFANRYLEAYEAYRNNRPLTNSWKTAFLSTTDDQAIVLQHLLLGINAHINLDLGIAAAAISTRENIEDLQQDFNQVNITIAGLFAEVQTCLTKIAFPMHFIRNIDPEKMNSVLDFSIGKARDLAWSNALILIEAGEAALPGVIHQTDQAVSRVASGIMHPGKLMTWLIKIIRWCENNDVSENIGFLDS